MKKNRELHPNILVTCAFPYANGSIHLGHLLEHIQADVWVRYQKMLGKRVFFICADDAHGTPIMLKAKHLEVSCQSVIDEAYAEHTQSFRKFHIDYDCYASTHSRRNREFCLWVFDQLEELQLIEKKTVDQLYDAQKKIFLPDRFIQGNCPRCKSPDQYGDNCEHCGSTYNAINLIRPKSLLSNTRPVVRKSKHLFFDVPRFQTFLKRWIESIDLHEHVRNKIEEWFIKGLKKWNISRDSPYFGFSIPNHSKKYFYVWMDAMVCYLSTFDQLCGTKKIIFRDFWNRKSSHELFHFIGKDIVYFHSILWPSVLEAINFRKPTNLFVHGYVKIHGKKMSKSRGSFITADRYLSALNADCLRYYYSSKSSNTIQDIDLNFYDFMHKINSDLVNKVANLAARNASFIHKYFHGKLSNSIVDLHIYDNFVRTSGEIRQFFHRRNFRKAIQKIIRLTNFANQYIDTKQPWKILKKEKKKVQNVCSMGINFFRILMTYLKPITPSFAEHAEKFLNTFLSFETVHLPLVNHRIEVFTPLLRRITPHDIESVYCSDKTTTN